MATTAFRVGSLASDVVGSIKSCSANALATGHYMTLEFPIGVDYKVPTGKTFYITSISGYGTTVNTEFYIGHGLTGVASAAVAPTSWTPLVYSFFLVNASQEYHFDVFLPVPADAYPCILSMAGNIIVRISGIEV